MPAPHIPKTGTKLYLLLEALLEGKEVDPFMAMMEFNLPTVQARASELRRMGWPVRALDYAHPKLKDERIVVYKFDASFLRWIKAHPSNHPSEYPHQDGRGRFANWTKDDYERDLVG